MRGRILFVAGLGVGYVLGARAGRGAYDALRARADRTVHSPTVERALGGAKRAAEQAAPAVTGAAEGIVAAVSEAGSSASAPAPAPAPTVGEDAPGIVADQADETATATD